MDPPERRSDGKRVLTESESLKTTKIAKSGMGKFINDVLKSIDTTDLEFGRIGIDSERPGGGCHFGGAIFNNSKMAKWQANEKVSGMIREDFGRPEQRGFVHSDCPLYNGIGAD